jgi:integrase
MRANAGFMLRHGFKLGSDSIHLTLLSHVGFPVEPRNLRRDFVRVLKVAKVPGIRFRDLRHSAASLLLAQGIPVVSQNLIRLECLANSAGIG